MSITLSDVDHTKTYIEKTIALIELLHECELEYKVEVTGYELKSLLGKPKLRVYFRCVKDRDFVDARNGEELHSAFRAYLKARVLYD